MSQQETDEAEMRRDQNFLGRKQKKKKDFVLFKIYVCVGVVGDNECETLGCVDRKFYRV